MPIENRFPWYAPRFWHGMPASVWGSLLSQGGWRFDWTRLHFVASVSTFAGFNSAMGALQHAVLGRKIAATELAGPPVFVLGHWRSGTTLLHELLHLDQRYSSPNTFQCFAPWHFVLTEPLVTRFGSFLLPEKRPMDNMRAGWKLPQEDEFALMALGSPTTYRRIAFPRQEVELDTLSSRTFPPEQLQRWKRDFDWFLRAVTYKTRRPLILKSPPHTGRLATLAEMYPEAKFVHIARHPYELIPSTIRLWQSLSDVQGLQTGYTPEQIERFVFSCFERMYDGYEYGLERVAKENLFECTVESLTAAPVDTVAEIYQRLRLGDFEPARPAVEARVAGDRDYKKNVWNIEERLRQEIDTRCRPYADRFGYELSEASG